ncbi:nuclease [Aestuariimicrobium soli]|uniref:nuclease n=1 Tax=Aestuariimicrobium soli TaxID=2035834 RepID=UPI003EB8AA3C
MPLFLPPEPHWSPSELAVAKALENTLSDDDVVLCQQAYLDIDRDGELDFLVMMPGSGFVFIEAKGGHVCHDEWGQWWTRDGAGEFARIDPVGQARRGKYWVLEHLERHPLWGSRTRVAAVHTMAAPFSHFPDDFGSADLSRDALHDADDLTDLGGRLRRLLQRLRPSGRVPTEDDVDVARRILLGGEVWQDGPRVESEARAGEVARLTQEQYALLGVTRALNRVEVRGSAGSGKTTLALEQARQLAAGRGGHTTQRIALICYTHGLAEYLKRQVETWPKRSRPAFVGRYEELGAQWGITRTGDDDPAWWEEGLPARMAEAAPGLPTNQRFDSVLVDEAQDFADSWWLPLLGALRDPENGGLYTYTDPDQAVFGRRGSPKVPLVPLLLDHNLRNTRQIAESLRPFAPHIRPRGADGPAVEFVPVPAGPQHTDDVLAAADDEVEALLEQGWEPGDIALITTGRRHPVQVEAQARNRYQHYWDEFFAGSDVFYGTALGFKGLERRAVVLAVNDGRKTPERAPERLYVGMSRATDLLVVVGDPDHLAASGVRLAARR